MGRRYRVILVPVMWMIAGVVLGATVALLWVKGLSPDWIEATGTWFGGVATVLTLLWAVQTFRADQAHREMELQSRHEEQKESRLQEERAQLDRASRVSVALRTGGGYGDLGKQTMTSVHIDVDNDTDENVKMTQLNLEEPLVSLKPLALPFRIEPRSTKTMLVEIADVDAHGLKLSGHALTKFGARMTYELGGQTWRRTSSTGPSQIL